MICTSFFKAGKLSHYGSQKVCETSAGFIGRLGCLNINYQKILDIFYSRHRL